MNTTDDDRPRLQVRYVEDLTADLRRQLRRDLRYGPQLDQVVHEAKRRARLRDPDSMMLATEADDVADLRAGLRALLAPGALDLLEEAYDRAAVAHFIEGRHDLCPPSMACSTPPAELQRQVLRPAEGFEPDDQPAEVLLVVHDGRWAYRRRWLAAAWDELDEDAREAVWLDMAAEHQRSKREAEVQP